jgi:hypothetical protein
MGALSRPRNERSLGAQAEHGSAKALVGKLLEGTSHPSRLARICRRKLLSMSQTLAEHSAAPTDLSAATDYRDRPLPVAGFKGSHEEIERQWYEEVYRGRGDSMAQLTWRAVLIGSCLGGVLSLTNLYIGLKAGWGFGVAITASILSYAIWTSFRWLLHRRHP